MKSKSAMRPRLLFVLVKLRARIGRDDVEIRVGRIQLPGVAGDGADRLLGIFGKADHKARHGANAQAAAILDELPLPVAARCSRGGSFSASPRRAFRCPR